MERPVVILVTPNPNDANAAIGFLRDADIEARAFGALAELAAGDIGAVGCAVLVEEALVQPEVDEFLEALAAQPTWSDLPLVLIANEGASLGSLVEKVFPESGNMVVLERPLHPVSLVSAVRVGLRARHRQLEVRDLIEQRSNALRMRDEFLAMLSHELRNPLAPMRNAVYIMKRLDLDNELFVKTRDLIDRQISHMARLVDDLLDVSRLEVGKVRLRMRGLDLSAAARSATESCRSMIEARGQTLDLELAAEPLYVRADPVRIEQVIGNLITNAAKFTPEGGKIVVQSAGDAETVSVTVRDSGIGIEAHMLGSVFDLFRQDATTLERSGGGLGIGLTVVKRLAELHGGTAEVTSEGRGRGSQFTVRLPRSGAAPEDVEPAQGKVASGAGRRVLVIEDNGDIRQSLGMLLTMWGHSVDYAESGPTGVERAGVMRPDIALIDIGLPGLTGYEVAKQIRGIGAPWARKMKLVALTGYGRDADRDKAFESGFDFHLVKPVDPNVLAEMLSH